MSKRKPREKVTIEVAVKKVYPQKCARHPDRDDTLKYVYNGLDAQGNTDPRAGQLLCEECRV